MEKKLDSILQPIKKVLKQTHFSDLYEKVSKDFLNWVLTMNIGIASLLVIEFRDILNSQYLIVKYSYLGVTLISISSLIYIGYVKYLFFKRDFNLNLIIGALRKQQYLLVNKKITRSEKFDTKVMNYITQYHEEISYLNKLSPKINYVKIFFLTVVFLLTLLLLLYFAISINAFNEIFI